MAERKAFQAKGGEISAPSRGGAPNALAAGLEEFAGRIQQISSKLIEHWVSGREREETAKGTAAGASGDFTPVRSGTRAGDAYDQAGLESYFQKLKIQTSDDVERIYGENKDDPAKLENAVAAYGEGVSANIAETMPELVPHFQSFFDRTSRPYRRQAAADYDRGQVDQARADTSTALASMYRQHEQRAFLSDGSPDGIADISLNRTEYLTRLVQSGPPGAFILGGQKYDADPKRSGAFSVEQIGKEVDQYDRAVIGARIKGEFDRAFKLGRGERFVDGFMGDKSWLTGHKGLPGLDLGERDQLAGWMRGQISAQHSINEAANKALGQAVDSAVHSIQSGENPGGLDNLVARTRGSADGERLRLALNNQDSLTQFYRLPPGQQAAALEQEREGLKGVTPAMGDENYARETGSRTSLIDGMQRARQVTMDGLKKDPFGFAIQVGNVAPQPPLLGEDGTVNEASLHSRDQEASRVSNLYGLTVPPLTDPEIDALGQLQATADPVRRSINTSRLVTGMPPDRALALFERMDKKGYLVDAAAGSMALDGAPELAQMIYQGDSILQPVEGKSAFKFPDTDFDTYFTGAASTAFALNPRAELTIKEAAKRIYVANLARSGTRPDADVDGSAVKAAVESVLGGPLIKHSTGMFGSSTMVTPPFRGATGADFDNWWESLDAASIKSAGGLAGWKDADAADLIRDRGLPVEIAQGVYKVVIPGAGPLDLTAAAKSASGNALVLHFKGR